MKKVKPLPIVVISLFLFTTLSSANNISDTTLWKTPTAKLKAVFVVNSNPTKTDILKLYNDKTYELMSYSNHNSICIMKRDIGNYDLTGSTLKLQKPKTKTIQSDIYINTLTYVAGKGIYSSKFKSIFQKNKYLMAENRKRDYDFPFYLDPISKTIVNNKEAVDKIDLKDLVYQITKNKKSEREKMMAIINFIHSSIEYDYVGYQSKNYTNPQKNAKQILAGKNRIAVCAGYAYVFEELCSYANISCRYILGYAKSNFNKIENKGIYHAWNIVKIQGKEELYDITWADGEDDQWLNVNPKLMIYSHFPDNEKDQLLLEPIKYEDFVSATVVLPKNTTNQFTNWFPKKGVVFTDSLFSFTIDALVNNISINEMSGDYFNVVYVGENKNTNKSYPVTSITNFRLKQQDGKTTINIPLSQDISAINIYVNGCSYAYKVIKGNQFAMYKSFQKTANKNNLDNYIKGVLASVVLNDSKILGELVGNDNPLFFDKSNQIKKELVDKFKNWQGSVSSWEKEKMTTIHLSSDAKGRTKTTNTITENRIYIGTHYVVFDEVNNAYAITSLK